MAPSSLWAREGAALNKASDTAVGQLHMSPTGDISMGHTKRQLVTTPGDKGFQPLTRMADWMQGIVIMGDQLDNVSPALQHYYSAQYTLSQLLHQHRKRMAQVYDRYFKHMRAPEKSLKHFVAMEEGLRRRMMQIKP